jgi:formamidopyrimidine-DNA glycosylase
VPELPEVETIARDVAPHAEGRRIVRAVVFRPDILREVSRRRFESALAGRRIERVWRRAKHLVLDLDDGARMVVQPRMTGAMLVEAVRASRDPYATLHLELSSRRRLNFRDVRRLGAVFLLSPGQWRRYDAALGPEPLEPEFTEEAFARVLTGTLAVKKAIMDQRRLAGVGNIYASEALWIAGLDPSRQARRIAPEEAARLRQAIVDVLRRSIEGRGTTFRDYRTGTGEPGNYQGRLAAYDRAGEPCLRCGHGRKIVLTHEIDGRATYFCAWCQV